MSLAYPQQRDLAEAGSSSEREARPVPEITDPQNAEGSECTCPEFCELDHANE